MKHELTPEVISQIVDFAKKYEPKGDLVGIPREVISVMLQRQYEQNGKWDVEVFEKCEYTGINEGGFNWGETIEKHNFWDKVIDPKPNLSTFFTLYPERFESEPQPEPVKQEENQPSCLDAVMPRFSVSLVYTKNIPNGTETGLRVLITKAKSSQEALGKGIEYFEKEMKGFNISNKVVLEINEA